MSRSDLDCLDDIQEAAARIQEYISGWDYDRFLEDRRTQDAVVRNLEIIGEAAKQVSDELRQLRADVPWKGLAGVRDKLIHHYFGVDYQTVWQIIRKELPDIATGIDGVIHDLASISDAVGEPPMPDNHSSGDPEDGGCSASPTHGSSSGK